MISVSQNWSTIRLEEMFYVGLNHTFVEDHNVFVNGFTSDLLPITYGVPQSLAL